MYQAQKDLLRQHGKHFSEMASYVRECSEDELGELEAACAAVTESNIAWDCYHAAKFLEKEIAQHRREVAKRAELHRNRQHS